MLLRVPTPPASVCSNEANAANGSAKMFGPPLSVGTTLTFLVTPVNGMALVCVALPVNSQLVGNANPLPIEVGSPEVILKIPPNCQPPTTALIQPGDSLSKRRPLPTGSSHTPLAFIWCVTSKSDTLLRAVGAHEFKIGPANNPLRSTVEA